MPFVLWLEEVLLDAGLKVAALEGWQTRGVPHPSTKEPRAMGDVLGVMCHHTAGSRLGVMPSLNLIRDGRTDLKGPLAHLGLGRDGTYFVVAAGRCNHAGDGLWQGIRNGNSHFIGIEAENTGRSNDLPWPAIQLDAYYRGVAAILKRIGRSAQFCCGHAEYALPRGRKTDPTLDMVEFRKKVDAILTGTAPKPILIPPKEPAGLKRMTLRRGDQGPLVKELQQKLVVAGIPVTADSDFGAKTEAAVRRFQREKGLVPDGIVGPKTWSLFR